MGVVDELWRFPRWTQSPGEELANTISHGIGLLAALIGTPVLLLAALDTGSGFFYRHNHFRCDHAGAVPRVHALPCVAADAGKMRSTGVRSFRYLSANRWDLHAITDL